MRPKPKRPLQDFWSPLKRYIVQSRPSDLVPLPAGSSILLEDDPEGVDDSGDDSEEAEEDVEEKVTAAAGDHEDRDRGENQGEDEGDQAAAVTHPGLLAAGSEMKDKLSMFGLRK